MFHPVLVARFLMLFCQYTFRMFQLPFMWKQIQKFLMSCILVIRHLGDYIIQVIPWVYIVCLTGSQYGTDNRHINCCFVVATEEIIFYYCPIKILQNHKIRADFICEVSPFSLDFSRQTIKSNHGQKYTF